MMTLQDIASRVQRGLRPMAQDLTYRTTYAPKAAATAAIGATSITLGTLPAGMTGVQAGDTFGSVPYRIAADAQAVGGQIVASFSPALTAAITSGSTVSVTHDSACKGFVEILDTSTSLAPGVTVKDVRYSVLANTLPVTPKATSGIMVGPDGTPRTVKNAGLDPAGAVWVVLCSG